MADFFELRERYRVKHDRFPKIEVPETVLETPVTEKAFVISGNNGRQYLTGRVTASDWEKAGANRAFVYLSGRYVGADKANLNNAYWSTEDLAFGEPSVTGGPINLLHKEKEIVGCILDAKLNRETASIGNHLSTYGVLWKYLNPAAVHTVEQAAAKGELWQSMECVAEEVECLSACGARFPYMTWMTERSKVCAHLQRGGTRRMVNPTFLGSGLIFGHTKPGWTDANVEIVREAAQIAEENELASGNMTREDAEALVSQILSWANTTISD